jgi:hypothetical protein
MDSTIMIHAVKRDSVSGRLIIVGLVLFGEVVVDAVHLVWM